MSKITCLCAKNTWFSNAKAYVNISSRFSTAYFSPGGPWPPLKIAYAFERTFYPPGDLKCLADRSLPIGNSK